MHKHMLKMFTFCQNMLNGNIVLNLSSNFNQIQWQMFISKTNTHFSAVYPLYDLFVQKIQTGESYCIYLLEILKAVCLI